MILTPNEVTIFVKDALTIRKVPYIAGPPGIGKSNIGHQIGKEASLWLIDERLSQKLPEDMTGLPRLNEERGKAEYVEFDTIPMHYDKIPEGYNGWLLFLDELSSCSDEIMAAIYSLLLDRMIGGKKIHPDVHIMAAGNRESDSAIARKLPDTLLTRLLPCEMKTSVKDWKKWTKRPEVKSNISVIDFIDKYPSMLLGTIDHTTREENETYPTPRGWSTVFDIVNLHEQRVAVAKSKMVDSAGIPIKGKNSIQTVLTPNIINLVSAAVGVLAATTFKEMYNDAVQIPFAWDVAQSPSSTPIPSSGNARATLAASLGEYFITAETQSRDAIITYMNRMGEQELSTLFVQIIEEGIGETVSDKSMITDIKERMGVDDLNLSDHNKPNPDNSVIAPLHLSIGDTFQNIDGKTYRVTKVGVAELTVVNGDIGTTIPETSDNPLGSQLVNSNGKPIYLG